MHGSKYGLEFVLGSRSDKYCRRHIFHDLRPYVCTFEECDLRLFADRHDRWADELNVHRREWQCQFCNETACTSETIFREHTSSKHADTLARSSLEALTLQSERAIKSSDGSVCPLCDDWPPTPQYEESSTSSAKRHIRDPWRLFRRHLAEHMELLALLALPQIQESLQNTGEDIEEGSFTQRLDKGKEAATTRPATTSDAAQSQGSPFTGDGDVDADISDAEDFDNEEEYWPSDDDDVDTGPSWRQYLNHTSPKPKALPNQLLHRQLLHKANVTMVISPRSIMMMWEMTVEILQMTRLNFTSHISKLVIGKNNK